MIIEIEQAKSNKSTCKKCQKKIEAGELRGVDKYNAFGRTAKKYFCADCSKEILEICKVAIEKMLLQLK